MLFDKLCGIAEKHMPNLLPILRDAKIIDFPYVPHEVLNDRLSQDEVDQLRDRFFLPFPVIAIEDKASCVVLWDSVMKQEGCSEARYFVECLPYSLRDPSAFDLSVEGKAKEELHAKLHSAASKVEGLADAVVVVIGRLDRLQYATTESFCWSGNVEVAIVANKEKILVSHNTLKNAAGAAGWDAVNEMSMRNASAAIHEVFMVNSPDRFILEKTTDGVRKAERKKQGTVLRRSHERPTYTLLKPEQIREKLATAKPDYQEGLRPQFEGHERRRHFRTLRSDRFVHAQGKVLTIPATWVGPTEATSGKTHYRVCLEL